MSRHRFIKNIDIDEELGEDDDRDYYGKSVEDEPISSSAEKSSRERQLAQTIVENPNEDDEDYDDDDGMFTMDDVSFKPKQSGSKPAAQRNRQPNRKVAPQQQQKPTHQPAQSSMFSIGGGDDRPPSAEPVVQPPPIPAIELLRLAEGKPRRATSKSPGRMTPNTSFHQLTPLEMALSATPTHKARKRDESAKKRINLTIVGHVDAGKSTLTGHLLHQMGQVDAKTVNRYKQQANRMGKASFAYAWILDDTDEERARGVTMDVAHASFETPQRHFHILDSPGHRDFVPNMITGASQADAALLVVNASRGEFESGFDLGGQTREHALLLRSVGVQELVVAVNKMDAIEWSQERYEEVVGNLRTFLKKAAGFPNVRVVPVSGLDGENLSVSPDASHPLRAWYDGPSLVEMLDSLEPPANLDDRPLRLVVTDVHKSSASALTFAGKVETGHIETGDKVFVMPRADAAVVRAVTSAESASPHQSGGGGGAASVSFAGEQVVVALAGTFDAAAIAPGAIVCRGGTDLVVPAKTIKARIILFDDALPILKGTSAEVFAHALRELCVITKLHSINNRQTGEQLKANPRVVAKSMSAVVDITLNTPVCIEVYSKCRQLGRLSLRMQGRSVAAGIVEEIVK